MELAGFTIEPHWAWLCLGILLMAAEVVMPGAVLMWFGIAAILTGAVTYLADPSWEFQIMLFSIAGIGSSFGYWWWRRRQPPSAEDEQLVNRGGAEQIGQVLTLSTDIVNGHGRARFSDTSCRVDGPDLPAGSKVRVVGVDGGTLKVEAAE